MFTFSAKKVQKIIKVVPSSSLKVIFGLKSLITYINKLQKNGNKRIIFPVTNQILGWPKITLFDGSRAL